MVQLRACVLSEGSQGVLQLRNAAAMQQAALGTDTLEKHEVHWHSITTDYGGMVAAMQRPLVTHAPLQAMQ